MHLILFVGKSNVNSATLANMTCELLFLIFNNFVISTVESSLYGLECLCLLCRLSTGFYDKLLMKHQSNAMFL